MFFHFHPYEPFLDKDTTRIIVGTLPPPRFCTKAFKENDVDFCYGSKDNLLWQILNQIFNLHLPFENTSEAVHLRKKFLKKEKIGICDIVQSCYREKIDASDIGMKNIQCRDILGYLSNYDHIHTLIFTGGYCKNSPEYFLRKILREHNIMYNTISNKLPKIHQFEFNHKIYKTISLTSPSNAANRSIGANVNYKKSKAQNPRYTTFDFRIEQYKKVFNSNSF